MIMFRGRFPFVVYPRRRPKQERSKKVRKHKGKLMTIAVIAALLYDGSAIYFKR